jgi:hypothetical protein
MLSNNQRNSLLVPVGGSRYISEQLQKMIDDRRMLSISGLPEVKLLSPRQGQAFLNYLGCRLRTAGKKYHTTAFVSESARATFEKNIKIDFVSYSFSIRS